MKPHASPINCSSYFINDLSLSANITFDQEKPIELEVEDLEVESSILPRDSDGDWTVVLEIQQQYAGRKNAPYNFSLQLWGYFDIVDGIPAERAEQLVLTNGSSILFAIAREIVRDLTARGPYPALLLPTLSFFPLPKEERLSPASPESAPMIPERKSRKFSFED